MENVYDHRPLLFSLAYHVLGEVQEAEDIVQDIFENWFSKQPEVQFPKAYLSRAVINKSIDRLEALKKAREAYKGHWLPVPVVSETSSQDNRLSGDPLPYALLSLLEKLNPVERAAYILRHAFEVPYSEISEMCNLPEENARQLVHRAQEKLQKPRIRYEASIEERQKLLDTFLDAAARHDATTLKEVLHHDVILYADGGGKVTTALVPVCGAEKIINFMKNILKDPANTYAVKPVIINGSAGALVISKTSNLTDTICTLETDGKSITALYFLRNPEKIFS